MVVLHDHNNTVLHGEFDGAPNGRAVTEANTKRGGIVVAGENRVRDTWSGDDYVVFPSKYYYNIIIYSIRKRCSKTTMIGLLTSVLYYIYK